MFIEEFPGAVALDFCEQIVARFERSPALAESRVKAKSGEHKLSNERTGTQLWMQEGGDEWRAVNDALAPALISTMTAYATKYPGLNALVRMNELECTMPVIERVMPGQGFDWHSDQTPTSRRVVAGLLYLRTVASGGRTEFAHQGSAVVPEAGKIVLFPPFWTHYHRGATPESGAKYALSFFWNYRIK